MVGREAADGCRCGVDDQHHRQVRGRAGGRGRGGARARQERDRSRRDDARDPLRVAGRERARPARDVLRPAQARLAVEGRRPTARASRPTTRSCNLPIVSGGAYTITQYEKKGTTAFKPYPTSTARRRHASGVALTYYTNSDAVIADLEGGEHRLGRPGAVQGGQRRQEERERRRDHDPRRRDDQHHLELEPGEAEEPRAPQPGGEEGALDVRRPRPDHRRRLRRLRDARSRASSGTSPASSRTRTSARCRTTARPPTRRSTSSGTSGAPTASASCPPRPARTRRRRTRCSTRS